MAEAAEKADPSFVQEIPVSSVIDQVSDIQKYTYPFGSLIWAVVFAVKFCYLHLFRHLVDRQQPLLNYWKITMIITSIATVFNICAAFMSCPKFKNQDCKLLWKVYIAYLLTDLKLPSEM